MGFRSFSWEQKFKMGGFNLHYSAPARIDLSGGTLDIPPLCYIFENVLTINLAIDLRTDVLLTPAIGQKIKGTLNGEPILGLEREPLYIKTFEYFGVNEGFRLDVRTNVPRASGLGGSSTLLVALCRALAAFSGKELTQNELLQLVTVLEHRILGTPAGVQDAIAAIYGGLSRISFLSQPPKRCEMALPMFLNRELFLAYSRVQHNSGLNNWQIIKAACEGSAQTCRVLKGLAETSVRMGEALEGGDLSTFLACLEDEANLRNRLSGDWTPAPMKRFLYDLGGEILGKICGAGGGGCMLLFGENMPRDLLDYHARNHDLEIISVLPEAKGCMEAPV